MHSDKNPRKFSSTLVAGAGLYNALLGMFVVTEHSLGAYEIYKKVTVWLNNTISFQWTQAKTVKQTLVLSYQ